LPFFLHFIFVYRLVCDVYVCFMLIIYDRLRRYPAGVIRLKRSMEVFDDEPVEPFIADHPCLWLLRYNPTGVLLFVGRLSRPQNIPDHSHVSPSRDEL